MYTRARGVEVGKWPARGARRPRSRAISIRGSQPFVATDTLGRHGRAAPRHKNTPLFAHVEAPHDPGKGHERGHVSSGASLLNCRDI